MSMSYRLFFALLVSLLFVLPAQAGLDEDIHDYTQQFIRQDPAMDDLEFSVGTDDANMWGQAGITYAGMGAYDFDMPFVTHSPYGEHYFESPFGDSKTVQGMRTDWALSFDTFKAGGEVEFGAELMGVEGELELKGAERVGFVEAESRQTVGFTEDGQFVVATEVGAGAGLIALEGQAVSSLNLGDLIEIELLAKKGTGLLEDSVGGSLYFEGGRDKTALAIGYSLPVKILGDLAAGGSAATGVGAPLAPVVKFAVDTLGSGTYGISIDTSGLNAAIDTKYTALIDTLDPHGDRNLDPILQQVFKTAPVGVATPQHLGNMGGQGINTGDILIDSTAEDISTKADSFNAEAETNVHSVIGNGGGSTDDIIIEGETEDITNMSDSAGESEVNVGSVKLGDESDD
ncbi:hypothetical protein [Pseudodesulfovibrio portus]|uniref:Uncharacterized protein n=1 Tax=Pseudodesulfovibrio portus TaxID=231439 RepID=A0ABM8AV81_9BACT|nr:hypothetical protein [Pseudodesulfovibrio portus]BDQ35449.1 hypothetical protein JCM14722_29910 [Pseudodesulfovibrio portus]